jgi:hypothetical protein
MSRACRGALLVLRLAALGSSATAGTGYGSAGAGGWATMGAAPVPRGLAVWAGLAACPHGWPLWWLAALGASFEWVGSMRPVGGRPSTR